MSEETTTHLGVDITQFKSGLSEAGRYIRLATSEFDKATAGVDDWANTTDGLSAKITQLNKVLGAQEDTVELLRYEYERVCEEQGESSVGAQNLAIRLNKAEAAVKKTAAQIEKYESDLNNVGKSSQETTEETGRMSVAFGKAATAAGVLAGGLAKIAAKTVVAGIKGIAAASAALVTAFLATGEASKEYVTEMGKLETAFTTAGHTTDAATETYRTLQSVLGETDQAVEAANHLAKLATSEKELATWANVCTGVYATFGASLPIEGLTEAANETAKTGQLTGALADALNWAGVSEDSFQDKLDECSTEQERQALIIDTLNGLYSTAAETYRETNAEVIRANKANEELASTMANVGAAAMPVMSTLKLMGAALLNDLMPNIKIFGESFTEALSGSESAANDMGTAVGGMLQTLVQKIAGALPSIATVGVSIISSLVSGLISATPALSSGVVQIVQYFIQAAPRLLRAGASMVSALVGAIRQNLPTLLKSGGDMLYQLLQGIVSALPSLAQGAITAVGGFVQGLQTNLPIIMAKGQELLGQLGEGIRTALPDLVSQALDIAMNFATALYDNAPTLIETGFSLLSDLVSGIVSALPTLISKGPELVSKFCGIINDNFPMILAKGAELLWQVITGLLSAIPDLISNAGSIIQAIVDVFTAFNWMSLGKNIILFLKNGITGMVGAVRGAGKSVFEAVVNAIKSLPSRLLNLGKTAISNMGTGIRSVASAVRSAGANILNVVVSAITSLPSKLLALGKTAITKLAGAVGNGVATVKSKALSIANSVVNTLKSLPSKMVSIGKDIINGIISGIGSMVSKLYESIKNTLGGLVKKAKKALGIASPSKVMAKEIGKWIPAGISEGILRNTKVAANAMARSTRSILNAARSELSGSSLDVAGDIGVGSAVARNGSRGGATYVFNQYNTSPKALSRADIYRQTQNQLKFATANL